MTLKALQRLVEPPRQPAAGVVQSISGGIVLVATSQGVMPFPVPVGSRLTHGDSVRLSGAGILSTSVDIEGLPVIYV